MQVKKCLFETFEKKLFETCVFAQNQILFPCYGIFLISYFLAEYLIGL